MTQNIKGIFLGLFGFALYAVHDVIVKYLGGSYAPVQVLFFSTLFSFPLVSMMLLRDTKTGTLRPQRPWWSLLRVISMITGALCVFYAFSVLPLAQTYALLFALPSFITLLSIPLLGERVGLHRGLAVIMGFVGVMIVVRPESGSLSLGHGAAILGAFASSLAMVIVRKIGKDERDTVLVLFPLVGIFLVMGVMLPSNYIPMPLQDLGATAILAGFGFIALICMINAYKMAEAALVASMQYSQIIWASLWGYLFFNENLDQQTIIGAGVIILSGLYIVYRESRTSNDSHRPVLRSRSRTLSPRIGPFLEAARRRMSQKDKE